jgi:hypothetical protein
MNAGIHYPCPCRRPLRSRLAAALVLAGHWLATPPGTSVRPIHPPQPAPSRPPARRAGSWDDDPTLPDQFPADADAFLRSVLGDHPGEDR